MAHTLLISCSDSPFPVRPNSSCWSRTCHVPSLRPNTNIFLFFLQNKNDKEIALQPAAQKRFYSAKYPDVNPSHTRRMATAKHPPMQQQIHSTGPASVRQSIRQLKIIVPILRSTHARKLCTATLTIIILPLEEVKPVVENRSNEESTHEREGRPLGHALRPCTRRTGENSIGMVQPLDESPWRTFLCQIRLTICTGTPLAQRQTLAEVSGAISTAP